MAWLAKETKSDINQLETKLTKTENKSKAKCQLRNKAKKAKQTNKHGGKKMNEKKKEKAKLNRSI